MNDVHEPHFYKYYNTEDREVFKASAEYCVAAVLASIFENDASSLEQATVHAAEWGMSVHSQFSDLRRDDQSASSLG